MTSHKKYRKHKSLEHHKYNHKKTRKNGKNPHQHPKRPRRHSHHCLLDEDKHQRNDFYVWANHEWIREVPKMLPIDMRYIRPVDNFKLIQDEMYKNVLTTFKEYIKEHGGVSDGKTKQMRNIYASFLTLDKEPVIRHIREYCEQYDKMVQENNLWKFLAYINHNEMIKMSCPIIWFVSHDEYVPGKISPHIMSPSLSLYDYRFYIEDSIIEKQMKNVMINVMINVSTSGLASSSSLSSAGGAGAGGGVYKDTTSTENKQTIEYMKYKAQITRAFLVFIDNVFTKCLGSDYEKTHNIKAQDVFDIECLLMKTMNMIDSRYDQNYARMYSTSKYPDIHPDKVKLSKAKKTRDNYNSTPNKPLTPAHYSFNIRGASRIFIDDSIEHTDINWREFAEHIGYDKDHIPPYYIAQQVGYLKMIASILKKEWASDKWKSYWFFIYMRQIICFHDTWRDIYLEFNETLIRGRDVHFPREYLPIIGLGYTFPRTMSDEFTKKYKNEEMKTKVREIGNTILECYKKRIERNTWMSPYTKKGAMKKLNTISLCIGEAHYNSPDPVHLEYEANDAWGNLLKRSIHRTRYNARNSSSIRPEDIELMNWLTMKLTGFHSYIVNAYYMQNTNSIYIPTAYMHSMNVKFGRGYEYDLASIGFTFGHEISHALHVQSRVYNDKGIIKNWWTREDIATYEKKIARIRKQYEFISKKYGFMIDGTLSLSENLADITGMAVCEDALRAFHESNTKVDGNTSELMSSTMMSGQMCKLSFQHFYTYYAIQNRQYANRREILVQVMTNPHLDAKIRTNVPLMRSKTFSDVFDVKSGDKMYGGDFDAVF